MRWRLLPFSKEGAAINMAIDEAVGESVSAGGPPTIRLYGWEPSAVSVGCFQSLHREVDLRECSRLGVDIVRRRTGGGAVYHDSEGEITYSVITPEVMMGKDIIASYREVCSWVIDGLGPIGIRAEFHPINDILVKGKKISGCAQTRRGGVFLQHGTILYKVDVKRMFRVLKADGAKLSDKDISSFEERVTDVVTHRELAKEEVLASMERAFCSGKEFERSPLEEGERERALQLAEQRYRNEAWTRSR